MKLYEVYFSFEFGEGGNTAVYPTLAAARRRSIEILKEHMQDLVDTADRLDMAVSDRGIPEMFAEISVVEVPRINAQTLCAIINSSGGSYAQSTRAVMTITLPAGAKRPVIKRSEGGTAP